MEAFQHIRGNEDVKAYFTKVIKKNKLSHSYIFEGPYGVGKNTFALALAKYILCEAKEGNKPCNSCKSCYMTHAGTHPDLISIEKDTKVTKIETIRNNMVKEMDIKPYQSDYKVVIVKAADTITIEGQNAMLKTIEEPPSYGIIILVCENASRMLPTIKSRCIMVRFNPLTKKQLDTYLIDEPISESKREVLKKLSEGSIGKVKDILKDESFFELRDQAVNYLQRLDKADLIGVYDLVKEITEQKEEIEKILEHWLLWYRDIAIIKAVGIGDLYYSDYQQQLLDIAYKLTYNKVSQNIDCIIKALADMRQNIYSTFVIENLLLRLKERKK
ncbi:DNA polymerase III subunit delta' [Sporanaerobium hydrogeniformans]|uniref:DNA polymerase III subunit delta' n=1 Tax=Sporanaerobium hydrogeniformans TaxID=3072179 RepID=UPI0015D509A1|nr:DNA polymerase III subunit delta' [Sporanaerobium hydrogeniformans]